ncbi:MAG: rod shape-determining protein RodA [Paracoccaceae bacterium]|jgi:rod shape determining protein RodA|nr:rod shape-determining protein RodA [Paracoccaceae bacterium]
MSYLDYSVRRIPTGFQRLAYINLPIIVILITIAAIGFMMLFSVAGGSTEPWAKVQMTRFSIGFAMMLIIAFIPIWFWRNISGLAYFISLFLLLLVEFFGVSGMGAVRWLDLGFMRLQPSELVKVTVIMFLASYYDWLPRNKVSNVVWIIVPLLIILLPVFLVIRQPDLGTALLILLGGLSIMFIAGVSWFYFAISGLGILTFLFSIFYFRGTEFQFLKDYQYRRIDTFLDPASDPLGAGYHITQSKIALGSGGFSGRGFMQGTQSRLNFLPEKHTDFIFTTLAEEFGFIGGISLLGLYFLLIIFCGLVALACRDRYSGLVVSGITMTFFLYFAVNMAMVMGLAPVVGVPLPLVSYGGSAMFVLMVAFGIIQSADIHRAR